MNRGIVRLLILRYFARLYCTCILGYLSHARALIADLLVAAIEMGVLPVWV